MERLEIPAGMAACGQIELVGALEELMDPGQCRLARRFDPDPDVEDDLELRLDSLGRLVPYLKLVEREKLRVPIRSEDAYRAFYESDEVDRLFHELFADRLAEEAHQLAYHFYAARRWEKALHYYRLAGDRAADLLVLGGRRGDGVVQRKRPVHRAGRDVLPPVGGKANRRFMSSSKRGQVKMLRIQVRRYSIRPIRSEMRAMTV